MNKEKNPTASQGIVAQDGSIIISPVQNIYNQRPPVGVPFLVPPLQPHLIERPQIFDRIKQTLLTEDRDGRTLVVSALHGLGGVGKSTAVAVLAHHPDVQKRFPDAILWATLGNSPSLLPLLSGWIQALKDYDYRPTTAEAASSHLRSLLHDKAALLVVDDVWEAAHAQAFLVGGSKCQVVITTRNALIANVTSAELHSLNVMTPQEADTLLSARLGRILRPEEAAQAHELAREVGYLPLALELAAAQVKDGVPWRELISDLRNRIRQTLDLPGAEYELNEGVRKKISLSASFYLSLKRLPTEKLTQFTWLGLLPEDANITPAMAATLWSSEQHPLEVRRARDTLRYFRDNTLLQNGPPLADNTPTYRLHDLLHDTAYDLLGLPTTPEREGDLPGLGLTLTQAHQQLLNRYHQRADGGLWHRLPDDGYIHERLLWHMEQAECFEEIHKLLREETADRRHGWYTACEQIGHTAVFLQGIARAWELARNADYHKTEHNHVSQNVGLQVRYALVVASMNSLAANIPAALLSALVKYGVWFSAQGLAYARQIRKDEDRALTLLSLTHHLTGLQKQEVINEALCTGQGIRDIYKRAQVLTEVAIHLAQEGDTQHALHIAEDIKDHFAQAEVLTKIAPYLAQAGDTQHALQIVESIKEDYRRAQALTEIAAHLVQTGNTQHALQIIESIKEDYRREEALKQIAVSLAQVGDTQQALHIAEDIENDDIRAQALTEIAIHLHDSERMPILNEVLQISQTIKFDDTREEILSKVAACLVQTGKVQHALRITQSVKRDDTRAHALTKIAVHLIRVGESQHAMRIVESVRDIYRQVQVLTEVAINLAQDGDTQHALHIAQSIRDDFARAEVLTKIAPYLHDSEKIAMLNEALEFVRNIKDHFAQAEVLTKIAPYLAQAGDTQHALQIVESIKEDYRRAQALTEIAAHLVQTGNTQHALQIIESIKEDYRREEALKQIAVSLAQVGDTQQALHIVEDIENDNIRAQALTEIAIHLHDSERMPTLNEVLQISQTITLEETLKEIAIHLAQVGGAQQALQIAYGIKDDYTRAQALTKIAMHLHDAERMLMLNEVLQISQVITSKETSLRETWMGVIVEDEWHEEIDDWREETDDWPEGTDVWREETDVWSEEKDDWREEILSKIAESMAQVGNIQHALKIAQSIRSNNWREEAYRAITTYLGKVGNTQQALNVAQFIESEHWREMTLKTIATHLAQVGETQQALQVAYSIKDDSIRVQTLTVLTAYLCESEKTPIVNEVAEFAENIKNDHTQLQVLTEIVVHLAQTGNIQHVMYIARTIKDDFSRAQILTEVATHQPEVLRESWKAAQAIKIATNRGRALSHVLRVTKEPSWNYVYPIWTDLLLDLCTENRESFLHAMPFLTSILISLDDNIAVLETAQAIYDVGRWWP